ncbi:MAG: propionyl-CoA carboxylase [Alphaproteobacteria bacterium CG11_big_fil_rev_8_21_14_0_20_44_7]|nr:MAG: propionyl-CoA carboxylase [Alphaproteobacteria bacterium CG11_big_fil_rev_8_21_14_0_20_44_7]
MFKKILIANRGEIAVRIMRTCRKMGIKTVAIYSEADANALHVREADEAFYIGKSTASESYLNIKKIIDVITRSGAEAVHPGYGFLSENPKFARAVKRAGAAFIGPSAEAMKFMGDKIESKKLAKKAGVSSVPGHLETIEEPKEAVKIARKIGYPVMIKASAGGGGKGMRIARSDKETMRSFAAAKSEAISSFGDGRVFIEKFIENPRHIEIQILADQHGTVIALGERECSIQRRHQKIIEEAPSPFIDAKTRDKMSDQAKALAKAVKYSSAGTVEFVVDGNKNFYFLEMNTRLQVEHRVTELVTGVDLVEQMILVAAGEKLKIKQKDVEINGHAIEARIYAEDPSHGFLPSVGRLTRYEEPSLNKNLLLDSGVYEGGEVSMYYDPMIAKLCSYGKTRESAIKTMQKGLGEYFIEGVSANISFLESIIRHDKFLKGDVSTNFIGEEYPEGFNATELTREMTYKFISVATFIFLDDAKRASMISGQLPGRQRQIGPRWVITIEDNDYSVYVNDRDGGYEIECEGRLFTVYSTYDLGGNLFQGTVNNEPVTFRIRYLDEGYRLTHGGSRVNTIVRSPRMAELARFMPKSTDDGSQSKHLIAPMAGKIVRVAAKEGQTIKKGEELIVIEAMKMENLIRATHDVKIAKVKIAAGESVAANQELVTFEKA